MKNRVPFTSVKLPGLGGLERGPGGMLKVRSRTVSRDVPLLAHTWALVPCSLATKTSVPFTFVSLAGSLLPLPGTISRTSTVPAGVPSLFHSSVPVGFADVKSVAVKNNLPLTFVRFCGFEP